MREYLYVVIYNPGLRIVGPFKSSQAAVRFGEAWQEANEDNPCWNTISFNCYPGAQLVVNIEAPETAPMEAP